jgi:hypothetical protein
VHRIRPCFPQVSEPVSESGTISSAVNLPTQDISGSALTISVSTPGTSILAVESTPHVPMIEPGREGCVRIDDGLSVPSRQEVSAEYILADVSGTTVPAASSTMSPASLAHSAAEQESASVAPSALKTLVVDVPLGPCADPGLDKDPLVSAQQNVCDIQPPAAQQVPLEASSAPGLAATAAASKPAGSAETDLGPQSRSTVSVAATKESVPVPPTSEPRSGSKAGAFSKFAVCQIAAGFRFH